MATPILPVQQSTREAYLRIVVPLYRASIEGDSEAAKVILEQNPRDMVRCCIAENRETPLHIAAAAGHNTKFVEDLVDMMNPEELALPNRDRNTAFCLAAIAGNVDMAKIMVERNQQLPNICGSDNMMPLYLAAFHGNRDMVTYLYDLSANMTGESWTDDTKDAVLLKCVQAGMYDVALRILNDITNLPQDQHAWDLLQVLARKPEAFNHVESWPIISHITSFLAYTGLVARPALKVSDATLLLREIWERKMKSTMFVIDKILKGPMIKKNNMESYPSQVLFIAAKMNNTKFLIELIHQYPDLIWKRNDDGQTIFHISVSHRHHDIYRLLYEIGSMKDLITPITDHNGNNILHLVGKNPEKNAYDDWVTTPFQMFSELLWFKEVEDMVPPPCRQMKNTAGQTPQELFIENHEDLLFRGVNWINGTINQSMVVAALVCTIGFSVVYSIPGGFHQDNGLPIVLRDRHFIAYIVMDAISFILSTGSILIFLSIILSRHQRNTELLLKKWMLGQLALLTSIIAIVTAFAVSFFILYRHVYRSTVPNIIQASAIGLLCLYVIVYFSLYRDAIRAIFTPRYLFRPKHMLYHKNPKF